MAILVGTSGFDYNDWRGPFYPRFIKRGRPAGVLCRALRHGRAQRDLLSDARGERVPRLARRGARRVRIRGEGEPIPDPHQAARRPAGIGRLPDGAGVDPGDRLGPILLQLPPSLEIDLDRLDRTLEAFGDRVRVAVEPRHKSWFVPELCDVLRAARRGVRPGRSPRPDHAALVDGRLVLPADAPGECHPTALLRRPSAAVVGRAAGGVAGSAARRVRLLQQRPPGLCGPQRPDVPTDAGAPPLISAARAASVQARRTDGSVLSALALRVGGRHAGTLKEADMRRTLLILGALGSLVVGAVAWWRRHPRFGDGVGQPGGRSMARPPGDRRQVGRRDRAHRARGTEVGNRQARTGPPGADRGRLPDHRAARARIPVGAERARRRSLSTPGR